MTEQVPTGRRQSVVSSIAATLEGDVIAGRLAPGEHLKAQDIADRLQVSRFPVSAAFQQLAERGFAVHRKNQGYLVCDTVAVTDRQPLAVDKLAHAYQSLAEDRLSGAIGDRVSKNLLRERYGLSGA